MSFLSNASQWVQLHLIEITAVATGILYIFFTIKGKILLWLFGIISSGLYVWVFYQSGIYAYSLLYIYYVVMGFYGWYNWGKDPKSGITGVKRTPLKWLAGYVSVSLLFTLPLYFILIRFTDSEMALTDALLTSGGMVATWMLTQKYIGHWLFWMVINVVSMGAMIYKHLYPSAFLFLVYGILAVKGYIEWNKELKAEPSR